MSDHEMDEVPSDTESTGACSSLSNLTSFLDQVSISGFSRTSSTSHSVKIEPLEYSNLKTSKILYPPLNLKRIGYYRQQKVFEGDAIDICDLPTRKDVGEILMYRIRKKLMPDCTVLVGETHFTCHLIVLQVCSEVANKYSVVNKIEIPEEECTPEAFKFIYAWMLNRSTVPDHLSLKRILEVYRGAKYMEIKELVDEIWQILCDKNAFKEYSAYYLYIKAKKRNMFKIVDMMYPRIKHFFIVLVCSDEWPRLSIDCVTAILRSNFIVVGSEMEVFVSALRWLLHEKESRAEYKVMVMRCVRFSNIEWWQLMDIQRNTQNVEFQSLVEDPAISKLLDDGIAFQITKSASEELPDWSERLGLQKPQPRSLRSESKIIFTYREFLIRLDQLRHSVHYHENMRRGLV